MASERRHRGLVLRGCLLLATVCLIVHIYLQLGRRARPSRIPPSGRADPNGSPARAPSRAKPTSRRTPSPWRPTVHPASGKGKGTGSTAAASSYCPLAVPRRKIPRWHIELQPWASPQHTFREEALRFLTYIKTPQVSCAPPIGGGPAADLEQLGGPWRVCLDARYRLEQRIRDRQCRVYSLGLGVDARQLELALARSGCEVHRFDPSGPRGHQHDSAMWHHSLSVGWRDPNPAVPPPQQRGTAKKLATILSDFGHRTIDVLKADMESAEWKILENLILDDVLPEIGQLLLEVHLHWPGFEVGGDDAAVVRYWFSLLKELECSHFQLFYSQSDSRRPRLFLRQDMFNSSSVYILGWVNSSWRPR
ncbi:probable methyltransferase-like protein 24 isoform X1 [Paramormyrops kingsleyae]|uniref:probable methyltransferase-like protein 24 isoform X1 n=1 Tax=Paramormyrops kingsleyae TaxID=1676925 RepID=UPI000CD63BFC|nr:methyltransferase-like protein 24 [Paramormyrops kingsleyae]